MPFPNPMTPYPRRKLMNRAYARRLPTVEQIVTTAKQMQAIESAMFAAGMPVAALMEKVAGKIAEWIEQRFPCDRAPVVGVLVGPGHNGGRCVDSGTGTAPPGLSDIAVVSL